MPDPGVPLGLVAAPVLAVGPDLAVVAANRPAQDLWGADVVDATLDALVTDPHADVVDLVRAFLRSTSPRPGGLRLDRGDGPERVAVLGCRVDGERPVVAVRFDLGGVGRFSELTRTIDRMNAEIARRRRVEDDLQVLLTTTVADLETANAALRRFVGGAAHDLRSPLSTLLGFAQVVQEDAQLEPDLREVVDRMVAVARRGLDLVTDLLDDALAAAELDAPVPVDVVAVLDEVAVLLEDRLAGHQLSAGSLPTVQARPAALRQVLLNLVSNALVHHGPGRVHVHVDAEAVGSAWVVRVADDGPGIPPSERERVFEQGVRLGAGTGTGYGLAHCRRIVEGLGGRLWFDDPGPAGGAVACVRLPAVPSDPGGRGAVS